MDWGFPVELLSRIGIYLTQGRENSASVPFAFRSRMSFINDDDEPNDVALLVLLVILVTVLLILW